MRALHVAPLLLAFVVASCGLGPDIRGKDRNALLASGRVYVGRVSLAQYQDFASSLRPEPDVDVTTQGIFAGLTLRF